MVHGYKTKAGILLICIAAVTCHFSIPWAVSFLCIGSALCFYGIYDRGNRNLKKTQGELTGQTNAIMNGLYDQMDSIKSRLKKPRLV